MQMHTRYLNLAACLLVNQFCLADSGSVANEHIKKIEVPISIHLKNYHGDNQQNINNPQVFVYTTNIDIGSSSQSFEVLIDDDHKETWVPDEDCDPSECFEKEKFLKSKSATFHAGGNLNLKYGELIGLPLILNGTVGYDSIIVAGIKAKQQSFGLVKKITPSFKFAPFDGVLGIGLDSLSKAKMESWLETVSKYGLVKKAQYSIYLSDNSEKSAGKLIIGDPDPDLYNGTINWHQLIALENDNHNGYNISFSGISIENSSIASCGYTETGCSARIDINSPAIVGPKSDILEMMSSIDLSKYCSGSEAAPDITINIQDQQYVISDKDYIIRSGSGVTDCSIMLAYWTDAKESWVFGAPLLRALYTVFDQTDQRVGFAKSRRQ